MTDVPLGGARHDWQALAQLALMMSDRKTTELPLPDLSDLQPDIGGWIERGVLVESDGRVRFFHEELFDYVYARAFAEAGRSLVDVLLAGAQDLGKRPMVRQILTYQRGASRERYSRTVRQLLTHPKLRFHLRDVVFTVLKEDDDPTAMDWATIESYVLDGMAHEHPAAWSVVCRPAWFGLLDRLGVVLRWAVSGASDDRDRATNLLTVAQRTSPERVASLLRALLPIEGEWDARTRWVLNSGDVKAGRGYFELLLEGLDAGIFDDGRRYNSEEFWMAAHGLPGHEPIWALELLDRFLRRTVILAGDSEPFEISVFPSGSDYWPTEFVKATALQEPRRFCQVVLPFVLQILERTVGTADKDVSMVDPWSWRYVTGGHDFRWAIYEALDGALRAIARSKPRAFGVMEASLTSAAGYESARYLLYRAWAANAGQFADRAVEFLRDASNPFRCGYADSPYWVTAELIQVASAKAPVRTVHELEKRILNFYPSWEKGRSGYKERGATQWVLLEAFAPRRLSEAGSKRLGELERKFGDVVARPAGIQGGVVSSPIAEESARKMNNRQWIAAIAHYDTEENRRDWLKGGAVQLSQVLEAETKADPVRFGRLALKFSPSTNEYYMGAILRGLTDAELTVEPTLIYSVLRAFSSLPGYPGARWMPRLLRRVANEEIPSDVLDIISFLAVSSPDPGPDPQAGDREGPEPFGGDLLTAGINSVRGSAAEGLSVLLWSHPERLESFRDALQHLVVDASASVRTCTALALRAVFLHDADLASGMFSELIAGPDAVLATDPAQRFIQAAAQVGRPEMSAVLIRMLDSPDPDVRRAGGLQSALAALSRPEAGSLVDRALGSDAASRRGVAEVAAANIADRRAESACDLWLRRLFGDDDEQVRASAAQWARNIEPANVERLSDLASAFIDSQSYSDDEGSMLRAIDQSVETASELALHAVARFVEARGLAVSDFRSRSALHAGTASKLAVRAYASASTDLVRDRALDLIDLLLAARAAEISDLLAGFD